ncbi:hypothetical protein SOMG_02330 [Schizosaccharomyces osmophilus]|uniref:Uncharacterized protein n=1 Tax=Schizosaccharomyces osmophilus TaxID=2545709 RepID=A0AAE9W6S8_9SCHI|nr:uncharacterized protein SOMG_02330 [Schizosaccharomyces osmophilus]WBW71010.1 hypothetical protein SOMG_02330 [Schizosaccharomyces osmophilus]
MTEKNKYKKLKDADSADVPRLGTLATFDGELPRYNEILNSHLDDLEKGHAPPYSENRHQEASTNMAGGNIFSISLRNVLTALLWLIFWPAKIVRIPEAQRRQENESARLSFCFILSVIVNFWFSYKYLVPFIKESMKESVGVNFQATVAAVLVVMAFYMFLYVCSLLLDFIALVLSGIAWIVSWIIAALGFRMSSERNDSTDGNWIPLSTMPAESENQSNDRSDNTAEQPSSEHTSEHTEQSPGLRQEPGQSRDVESGGN